MLWLMALVLPVQGVAGCIYTVLGPLHVHTRQPARGPAPKLVDLRRAAYGGTAVATMGTVGAIHVDGALHGTPQRHRHAFGDAGIQVIGDGLAAVDGADGDDGQGAAGSLAALAAVPPSPTAWQAPPVAAGTATRPAWAPSTADVRLLERPPRPRLAGA